MKKRLLLLLVLTGVMIVVSSSVFAASSHSATGYNDDHTVRYVTIYNQYTNNAVIDLFIYNNSSDESVVLNSNSIVIQYSFIVYESASDHDPQLTIGDAALNMCQFSFSTRDDLTTNQRVFTMTLGYYLNDTVLEVDESQHFRVVIDSITYRYAQIFGNSISFSIDIPDTTSQTDPFYEAQVVANDIAAKENQIHQAETQWYQNNETAIQAVGLDNFNFSSGTTGGLQVMQQQFGNIWTAIGDLNLIYTFTLLVSLATFILRHMPRTRFRKKNSDGDEE